MKSAGFQYDPSLRVDQTVDENSLIEVSPISYSPPKNKDGPNPKPSFAAKCHICSRYLKTKTLLYNHLRSLHTIKDYLDVKCSPMNETEWQCEKCHFWHGKEYNIGTHENSGNCEKNIALIESVDYQYDPDLNIDIMVPEEEYEEDRNTKAEERVKKIEAQKNAAAVKVEQKDDLDDALNSRKSTGDKKVKCHVCDATFNIAHGLFIHYKKFHTTKEYLGKISLQE